MRGREPVFIVPFSLQLYYILIHSIGYFFLNFLPPSHWTLDMNILNKNLSAFSIKVCGLFTYIQVFFIKQINTHSGASRNFLFLINPKSNWLIFDWEVINHVVRNFKITISNNFFLVLTKSGQSKLFNLRFE